MEKTSFRAVEALNRFSCYSPKGQSFVERPLSCSI